MSLSKAQGLESRDLKHLWCCLLEEMFLVLELTIVYEHLACIEDGVLNELGKGLEGSANFQLYQEMKNILTIKFAECHVLDDD